MNAVDYQNINPTVIVIFGGSGDLNKRKLIPALYNLYIDRYLPENFHIIGLGRTEYSDDDFRSFLKEGVDDFSRRKSDETTWKEFSEHVAYHVSNVKDIESYKEIVGLIEEKEQEWGTKEVNRLFYLSVAPTLFEPIAINLGKVGACQDVNRTRIIIEKPFGHDLKTAHSLNRILTKIFAEQQIFRIDHYLGKETVQNILTFRFTNALFEPIWNRNYIDHVQITVSETVGVGTRGGYYEGSGALRDMIQNHVLQLVSMIAMEPPISLEADEIRNKKVDVLKAMRRISPEDVEEHAVRGQYGPGWIKGEEVPGYRDAEGVAEDSNTETYAAAKFYIDNWRWQDVPIYVRTGKRMADKTTVIAIQLKSAPHRAFVSNGKINQDPNRIIINIQPEMGMKIRFQAKRPGVSQIVNPVEMIFDYEQAYDAPTPEAYETLLLDAVAGNAALFMRADQVEAAWEVVMPILEKWESMPLTDYPSYDAGSWGPPKANELLNQDGRHWFNPPARNVLDTVIEDKHNESKVGVINLHTYNDIDDLSYCAAELFASKSQEAVEKFGRFTVCLSGGSSSKAMYELLAKEPLASKIPWKNVHVFWGDERAVPIDHPDSNAGMAMSAFLKKVPIPENQIYPIEGGLRADVAALQYEEVLQRFFQGRSPRFDLVLLGLGSDGHTASLFPEVTISQKEMTWVKEVFVPKLDSYRITLTPQLINKANCVAFIAYGKGKADALQHVLEGPYEPEQYPAQLIQPTHGEVHWFVDNEAGGTLAKK
uniref:Glucose-6-phosphate 1-dehydrogenase n=1 Tax=Roseihalotalea indica TaxID=2867963 RepID=A0AA49JDF5_9BACT|nr:glucose-6-phosphate dehydrogenase [Tunicatimonas sp. TK19036]